VIGGEEIQSKTLASKYSAALNKKYKSFEKKMRSDFSRR
jgi:hypothetical protein